MVFVRSQRDKLRRAVHAQFAVDALYRAEPASEWVPVSVRVHDHREQQVGNPSGFSGAQMVALEPQIVFLTTDLSGALPKRGAWVSVVEGEAWEIGECDYDNRTTVTAAAKRLSTADATGLPVPS